MSLRYADTSLPDLLSRQSLSYSSNEHAQYIKMCLCNKGVFFKFMFYEEINSDQENEIIKVKDMQLYEKLLLSYNLFNHKTAI